MSILLAKYEDSLIGRGGEISKPYFSSNEPGGENQKTVLALMHYAFEYVLGWTPQEVIQRMNMYYIRKMKLYKTLAFINFPPDVRKNDIRYILSLMYPQMVHLNPSERAEVVFQRVVENGCQFPREYFIGVEGYFRFCTCFRYLFECYYPLDSVREIYEFCFSAKGKRVLNDMRLLIPAKQFEISFLDVIHDCTDKSQHADFYYSYYQFLQQLSAFKKVQGFMDIDHLSELEIEELL